MALSLSLSLRTLPYCNAFFFFSYVHRLARELGHTIIDPVPSLFTFDIKGDERIAGLAGVSVAQVEVRLIGPVEIEGGAKVLKDVSEYV